MAATLLPDPFSDLVEPFHSRRDPGRTPELSPRAHKVPLLLFPTQIAGGGREAQQGRQYDVATDGRFLINVVAAGASTVPITLLMNWNPALKK